MQALLQARVDVSQVVGGGCCRAVCINADHFVFLYFVAASALPSGHFFMCLTSHLGVAPKFYRLLTTEDTENAEVFFVLFVFFRGHYEFAFEFGLLRHPCSGDFL
ncbi:MAG: hypothetical protein ACKOEZ_07780, partial [Spartobacteria bacterium]